MEKQSIISRVSGLFRKSLANPSPDLLGLLGLSGVTSAGVNLAKADALRVPVVASSVRLISEAVASLDVMVMRGGEKVKDHPALSLLTGAANDWQSGFEIIRDLVADALCDDRGGMVWVNRVGGQPVELIRYGAGYMTVTLEPATGEPTYTRMNFPVDGRDVIHLRPPFGQSPLSLARDAIGVAYVLERHAARLFGGGARPSGALMFPKGMGEESVKRARAAWQATHGEGSDGGRTAILFDGAEFKPFTFASTDAQFLENRIHQNIEISRHFRIPPSMNFEMDRATFANSEQMGREFLLYCLEPWVRPVESALTRALCVAGERIVIDRDDLTRADLATRATAISSLRASMILDQDEARDWVNLPPVKPGQIFLNPNISEVTPDAIE